MKGFITLILFLTFYKDVLAQAPIVTSSLTIKDGGDNVLVSRQGVLMSYLIGTYSGWDPEAIFIGGYSQPSQPNNGAATKRIYLGGAYSGTPFLNMELTTGSLGLNTFNPQSYFHGGNNKVMEILNSNTYLNSQAHLILSTGSTLSGTSAGSITWISKNSIGNKGMAYIGVQSPENSAQNAYGKLVFATGNGSDPLPRMTIDHLGNMAIGTFSSSEKLTVNGKIKAAEIRVDGQGQPDYVFEAGYKVETLAMLERYIKTNKHLPGIPSAAEAAKNGLELGEMNRLLLKKVEELTLQLIDMNKKVRKLEQQHSKENRGRQIIFSAKKGR